MLVGEIEIGISHVRRDPTRKRIQTWILVSLGTWYESTPDEGTGVYVGSIPTSPIITG